MQNFRMRSAANESAADNPGDSLRRADDDPQNPELRATAAMSADQALGATLAMEALTPLPRARSLVLLNGADLCRPDLSVEALGGSSAAVVVVEPPSASAAGSPRPRARRVIATLVAADEVRLFPKKFHHGMLWQDIWGLPLPFLAFALTHREDVDPTIPEVRDAIARVNCPEGGDWGKNAQALLTPTATAFSPAKASKRKGARRGQQRGPNWSTSNWFVWLVLLEEAASRYAAGTFTPSEEA